MKPLTDNCPKPLLRVMGIPLIEHHLNNLKAAGITDIIINHAWLGEQIEDYFGSGQKFGVSIQYSAELEGALETAGGIVKALPLLGSKPFLIVNGDIYCQYPFVQMPSLKEDELAHLILVENPEHNPDGDFAFIGDKLKWGKELVNKFTYSGIGLYHPKLFVNLNIEKAPLAPILIEAMKKDDIAGSLYSGLWSDVGTPERLAQINQRVMEK